MDALRRNLAAGLGERDLFYLAREHFYEKQYQECIGLVSPLLEQPVEWPMQRSHAAIMMARCLVAINKIANARAALLRALQGMYEWRRWDQLALCMWKLGKPKEACYFGAQALAAHPDDLRLRKNQDYYRGKR